MPDSILSVREIQLPDIDFIVRYWFESDTSYLAAMGVDPAKLPTREQFQQIMTEQINTPIEKRMLYYVIWLSDGVPVGHCNTNPTTFGEQAYMHLHIWNLQGRKKGMGTEFVKLALSHFFENLQLKRLYCQPYALNPAPNSTLEKAGFDLIGEFTTTPGRFNFEQPVKLWEMSYEKYKK
jgi:RimJ/RimL family protein N-acetyltransferase